MFQFGVQFFQNDFFFFVVWGKINMIVFVWQVDLMFINVDQMCYVEFGFGVINGDWFVCYWCIVVKLNKVFSFQYWNGY